MYKAYRRDKNSKLKIKPQHACSDNSIGASREFLLLPPPSLLEWSEVLAKEATEVRLNGFIRLMVFGLMGVVGADLSGLMYTDGERTVWEFFRPGLGTAEELKAEHSCTFRYVWQQKQFVINLHYCFISYH